MDRNSRGFVQGLIDDGRPLISLTGVCLALSGGFALFQSATGHFLPHDIEFLQMTPRDLCNINECRIVHFMFHDRASFGGALIAIASNPTSSVAESRLTDGSRRNPRERLRPSWIPLMYPLQATP